MSEQPKRRQLWLPLITTLLLVVAVSGVWINYSLKQIQDRHQFIGNGQGVVQIQAGKTAPPTAPRGLWVFGEKGITRLAVSTPQDAQLARSLFPEAEVVGGVEP